MTLIQLRDKINQIIEETPSWANVDRIGRVVGYDPEMGWKDMEWLEDFVTICCDGQGMVAFQLVMEGDDDYSH
jgi:hypothetical protein